MAITSGRSSSRPVEIELDHVAAFGRRDRRLQTGKDSLSLPIGSHDQHPFAASCAAAEVLGRGRLPPGPDRSVRRSPAGLRPADRPPGDGMLAADDLRQPVGQADARCYATSPIARSSSCRHRVSGPAVRVSPAGGRRAVGRLVGDWPSFPGVAGDDRGWLRAGGAEQLHGKLERTGGHVRRYPRIQTYSCATTNNPAPPAAPARASAVARMIDSPGEVGRA